VHLARVGGLRQDKKYIVTRNICFAARWLGNLEADARGNVREAIRLELRYAQIRTTCLYMH
jgi:hypothetical protein